nr:hypothetical protein [Mycobacterium sp. E3298]
MKINITERARELWKEYCPLSTLKCDSFEELDYKIQRSVDLGRRIKIKRDGTMLYHYHNRIVFVKNNEVIGMAKVKTEHKVSERLKLRHYYQVNEICV